MTAERNSLLPGSIGQVACRGRWDSTGGSRWNSSNHIGNVIGTSSASGYFVEAVNTDAFGNPLASTQTGEWAGGLGGNRGLTTKELDPAGGMYYFYQRWYDPQTATFASRAPYPTDVEHPYSFALQRPTSSIDPRGTNPTNLEKRNRCLRRANEDRARADRRAAAGHAVGVAACTAYLALCVKKARLRIVNVRKHLRECEAKYVVCMGVVGTNLARKLKHMNEDFERAVKRCIEDYPLDDEDCPPADGFDGFDTPPEDTETLNPVRQV